MLEYTFLETDCAKKLWRHLKIQTSNLKILFSWDDRIYKGEWHARVSIQKSLSTTHNRDLKNAIKMKTRLSTVNSKSREVWLKTKVKYLLSQLSNRLEIFRVFISSQNKVIYRVRFLRNSFLQILIFNSVSRKVYYCSFCSN